MSYKAFVSSTFEDLKQHRAHVIRALRRAGFVVDPMEDWPADNDEPKRFSQDRLKDCHLCVLLVGFRRGYVPDGETRSITQLEYDAAVKQGIDIVPFLLDENAPWPRKFDELDKDPELRSWRTQLAKRHGRELFTLDSHSIDMTGALGRWLSTQNKSVAGEQRPSSTGMKDLASLPIHSWDIEKNGSPYPGLMYFTKHYAPVFFGRDTETQDILDRMCLPEGRFLLVSGNSGVGKSSLVDAGVLSEIEWKRGLLPWTTTSLCVRMVPSQGRHPFGALMRTLHPHATRAGLIPDSIETDLIEFPSRLSHHLQLILSKGTEHDSLVLFLDQMEELFTAQNPNVAHQFLKSLFEATQEAPLWVLATIRSDHLHHCHGHAEMRAIVSRNSHYAVGPIKPFLLPDLILKPARCAGLAVTERLAQRILYDMGSQGGHLPLLAFVLNELFTRRSNHELSEAVYEQLGGLTGAIAHRATEVEGKIQRKGGAPKASLLRTLFQSLVVVNSEGLPNRRRPLRSDFPSAMSDMIDTLVQERLLHIEGEQSATVSVSHEALFQAWPSLREYVATNKKQLMDQTLLENRARKWGEMGKPWFSGLASGREYKDFRRTNYTPTALTKEYLSSSRRARWVQGGAISILIFLVAGIGGWLWKEGRKGLNIEQAVLKLASKIITIHIEPDMHPLSGGTLSQGDIRRGGLQKEGVNEVTIKPFAIGRFEVTFEEYDRFVLATERLPLPNDASRGRGRHPVINVSWNDAKAYAVWLSEETGQTYRLPTEAEWIYAAVIEEGRKSEIFYEDSQGRLQPIEELYGDGIRQVGRVSNSLGLYDMMGNVAEWVETCWHKGLQLDQLVNEYSNELSLLVPMPHNYEELKEKLGDDNCIHVARGQVQLRGMLGVSDRLLENNTKQSSIIGFRLAKNLE